MLSARDDVLFGLPDGHSYRMRQARARGGSKQKTG
jgi:hypothetical protein